MSMLSAPRATAAGEATPLSRFWRVPKRLAYVVSHSLPLCSDGYAVRSQAISEALSEAGHEVIVFTRPGLFWDTVKGSEKSPPIEQRVGGIRHIHLPAPPLAGASRIEQVRAHAATLTEAFRVFRPSAVLGASNWQTAEVARRAAGRIGASFFYEQRGFWELAPGTPVAAAEEARKRELEIAQAARGVFTLNGAMKAELVNRGVPEGRIQLLPNGLSYRPRLGKVPSRSAVGIKARYLLGYIGSLNAYEGVDDLIRLVARLRRGEDGLAPLDVAALILGSDAPRGRIGGHGTAQARLVAEAQALGVAEHVHFQTQVPVDEVGGWYTLCDALVLPRRRTPVTELVPPIKPYSAFAYGLPVFMTDLPPLAEIAAEINGSLFPEGDLATLGRLVHHALLNGHPATLSGQSPALTWARRIRPLSVQLDIVAQSEMARNLQLLGQPEVGATGGHSESYRIAGHRADFDLQSLPAVALKVEFGGNLVHLGPSSATPGQMAVSSEISARRSTLLDILATVEPGRLVIDWAGLCAAEDRGEWEGLWSIQDMRLNRLIMDAVRIAHQRGWRIIVNGPVSRAEAPLYRTVAAFVEEMTPIASPKSAADDRNSTLDPLSGGALLGEGVGSETETLLDGNVTTSAPLNADNEAATSRSVPQETRA